MIVVYHQNFFQVGFVRRFSAQRTKPVLFCKFGSVLFRSPSIGALQMSATMELGVSLLMGLCSRAHAFFAFARVPFIEVLRVGFPAFADSRFSAALGWHEQILSSAREFVKVKITLDVLGKLP